MPAYPARDIDSTPGWRVGLLLLAFVVVAVLVDHFTAFVERVLAKRHGLLEATRKLKKEIFQLGVVSLLLIAVQVGASCDGLLLSSPFAGLLSRLLLLDSHRRASVVFVSIPRSKVKRRRIGAH
jgi:hypothetical protein